jgi:hypothetical protein
MKDRTEKCKFGGRGEEGSSPLFEHMTEMTELQSEALYILWSPNW